MVYYVDGLYGSDAADGLNAQAASLPLGGLQNAAAVIKRTAGAYPVSLGIVKTVSGTSEISSSIIKRAAGTYPISF